MQEPPFLCIRHQIKHWMYVRRKENRDIKQENSLDKKNIRFKYLNIIFGVITFKNDILIYTNDIF